MEVQIFGVKKSADTRAALRFFAERRIKTHFTGHHRAGKRDMEDVAIGRRCEVCGAELVSETNDCPYAESFERAPGIGDVLAMASGELSDAEHELAIARWRVHHPETVGPRALEWARRRLAEEA